LRLGIVAVSADDRRCDMEVPSPEAPEEPHTSGSGEVAGVLLSDDNGELETLLLIVWVSKEADVGEGTKRSMSAAIG
jgi:hypothetical protein